MSIISKSWWAQAAARYKAKSPDFFKKMRPVLITIFSIGAGGVIVIKYMESEGYPVPNLLGYICTFLAGCGIASGLTAKLPVYNPDDVTNINNPPPQP